MYPSLSSPFSSRVFCLSPTRRPLTSMEPSCSPSPVPTANDSFNLLQLLIAITRLQVLEVGEKWDLLRHSHCAADVATEFTHAVKDSLIRRPPSRSLDLFVMECVTRHVLGTVLCLERSCVTDATGQGADIIVDPDPVFLNINHCQ